MPRVAFYPNGREGPRLVQNMSGIMATAVLSGKSAFTDTDLPPIHCVGKDKTDAKAPESTLSSEARPRQDTKETKDTQSMPLIRQSAASASDAPNAPNCAANSSGANSSSANSNGANSGGTNNIPVGTVITNANVKSENADAWICSHEFNAKTSIWLTLCGQVNAGSDPERAQHGGRRSRLTLTEEERKILTGPHFVRQFGLEWLQKNRPTEWQNYVVAKRCKIQCTKVRQITGRKRKEQVLAIKENEDSEDKDSEDDTKKDPDYKENARTTVLEPRIKRVRRALPKPKPSMSSSPTDESTSPSQTVSMTSAPGVCTMQINFNMEQAMLLMRSMFANGMNVGMAMPDANHIPQQGVRVPNAQMAAPCTIM
jgi:hypothetical protein